MKSMVISLGIILLILGAVAYTYLVTEKNTYAFGLVKDENTKAPYRNYAFPLGLAGIILIIVGAMIPSDRDRDLDDMYPYPERAREERYDRHDRHRVAHRKSELD